MACQMAVKQFFLAEHQSGSLHGSSATTVFIKSSELFKRGNINAKVVREIIFILPLGVYAPNFTQVPLQPPRAHQHITPHPFINELSIVRALNTCPD